MGYLTPDEVPDTTMCRALFIPNNQEFLANVTGALQLLTFPENWTEYGLLTPDEAAEAMQPMFDAFCFNQGACRMIGEIIAYAGATSPDTRWLLCDGASLLRADYPDLFAVIGTTYGSVDGTHFNIPDLRSRTAVMAGPGSGLTNHALGSTFGEETHTLTLSESPAHSHTTTPHTHLQVGTTLTVPAQVGAGVASAPPGFGNTGSAAPVTDSQGGGGAHNNIQPSLAINYLIVALT